MRAETVQVGMPKQDPVFGKLGPLVPLWDKAAAGNADGLWARARL